MHSITSPQKPPCSCYSASPWYNMALPSRRRFTSCARTLGALWMVKVVIFPCHGWAHSKLPRYIYIYLNHHLGKRFEFFATSFKANSKCFYLEHFGILGGSTFKVMGENCGNFPSVLYLGDFWEKHREMYPTSKGFWENWWFLVMYPNWLVILTSQGDVPNFKIGVFFLRWRNSSSSFGILFWWCRHEGLKSPHHCFSRVALFCCKPCQHILKCKSLKSQGSSIATTKSHRSYQLLVVCLIRVAGFRIGMSLSGTLTKPRWPMESEIHMGNDLVLGFLGGQRDGKWFQGPQLSRQFMWSKGGDHWLPLNVLKTFKHVVR